MTSMDGRQLVWRLLSRVCRPNIDTVICLLLFSIGGLVVTVLWTLEPPRISEAERRAESESRQKALMDEILRERDELQRELANRKRKQLKRLEVAGLVGQDPAEDFAVVAGRERLEDGMRDGSEMANHRRRQIRFDLEDEEVNNRDRDDGRQHLDVESRLDVGLEDDAGRNRKPAQMGVARQQNPADRTSTTESFPRRQHPVVENGRQSARGKETSKLDQAARLTFNASTKVFRRTGKRKNSLAEDVAHRAAPVTGNSRSKPEVEASRSGANFARNSTNRGKHVIPDNDGRRWCTVYNTTPEVHDDFDCIRLRIKPPTTVCLYADEDDVHVSRHMREDGLWEPHVIRIFQNLLFQNADLGVVDVGSHVGQYALLAASMGRRVVAVEPYPPSLRRLHKAIKIGHLEDRITVLQNAVSDTRRVIELTVPDDNQGGASVHRHGDPVPRPERPLDTRVAAVPHNISTVLMDDLLEVTGNFTRAVMKIDIEGHEHRALRHADRLFDAVQFPYIFMEWIKLKAYFGAEVDDSEDKRLAQRLVDWLTDRGYTAYSLILIQQLKPQYWYGWPDDIFWQHRDADPFF